MSRSKNRPKAVPNRTAHLVAAKHQDPTEK